MDESLKTSLKEDFMFEPMSLEDAKKLYNDLKKEKPSAMVKNAMSDIWFFTDGLTKDYRNNKSYKTNESLKESYTEVDTIESGEETYRVIGGGFNPRDALVSVEDKKGNKKRLSSGDVIEFYTWYDKKGNVVHEPSDMDESLKEDTITIDDDDKKALRHLRDYRGNKTDIHQLHKNVEKVYGSKSKAVPRLYDLDKLSNDDINKALGEGKKRCSK